MTKKKKSEIEAARAALRGPIKSIEEMPKKKSVVAMGRKPKPELRKTTKRKRTAYHEAAHAVVLYRTAGHVGGGVSIVPRTMEGWVRLGYASDGWSDSFN